MNAAVDRIALAVHAPVESRTRAADVAREVRAALPDALRDACGSLAAGGGAGVAVIPRMRVTLRAPLARVRGSDLARAIAEACVGAATTRCEAIGASASEHDDGASPAERAVDALRSADGVHLGSREHEAAAWLVALAREDRSRTWRASPYADLHGLPLARAFAAVAERVDSAELLLDALGPRWARAFAERCDEHAARRLLARIPAAPDVPAEIWRAVAERFAGLGALDARSPWRIALVLAAAERDAARRRAVAAAARTFAGSFDARGGATAASAFVSALSSTATASPSAVAGDVARASDLTGLWCLLPHLARLTVGLDERARRAAAVAVAEYFGGEAASDDPAIAAWCGGERRAHLAAALPADVRAERLAVAAVRAFARTLRHFEHARCTYVLRAILSGPGSVGRRNDCWEATLPRAPLRVVLDRAGLLGEIAAPWDGERYAFVRDDE